MLISKSPTLLRQICDWPEGRVKKIKAAFRGVEARHEEAKTLMERAEELQRRWDKAPAEAVQNREALRTENETTAEDGGRVQYSIDPGFAKAIDEWDGKKKVAFRLGHTSDVLQTIGVKNRRIILHSGKLAKIFNNHPEMTKTIIKGIPEVLEHPIMVLESNEVPGRIVIFGELFSEKNDPVLSVLELNPKTKKGEPIEINILANAYAKDNSPAQFIRDSGLIYIDRDKKRANKWMQRVGLQLPSDASNTITYGSIGSVTYQDGEVKINSTPYEQYMQTEREDVGYTTKVPTTKSPGQIAFEKAQTEKAERIRKEQEKKAREQKSERDNSASDRELLREAAEHEGASEELKKYARKADNLEAWQRRLERQEAKLKSKELSSEERAALEKRAAEKKALIARTQDALQTRGPMERREGRPAWKDPSPRSG